MSVREARGLPLLLDKVQAADEVVVLRRRIEVGGLVRPEREAASLPDLSGLRASVKLRGRALSHEITEARREQSVLTYVDTSVLAAFYCPDLLSQRAQRALSEEGERAISLTTLTTPSSVEGSWRAIVGCCRQPY
jgi:hypothetical protein